LCKPAFSKLITKPRNREGCGRKIPWGAWMGLLSLSLVWLLQAR